MQIGESLPKQLNCGNIFTFLALFSAFSIVLSLWLGTFFWRDSLIIAGLAVLAALLVMRKFPLGIKLPKTVVALAVLMFILCAYPAFVYTPFFGGSADAAQTITMRVIGETIPQTYEPYSGITLGYYLGYHLFTKIFVDLFPVVPDTLWLVLCGAFFAAMELIAVYLLGRKLGNSENAGLYPAILFLGTKSVFQNMYWGMHPMIAGMFFAVLAAYLFLEKKPHVYLFLPLTLACHAGAAFNAFILLAAMVLFLRGPFLDRAKIIDFAKLGLSSIVVIPSLLTTYAIFIANAIAGNTPDAVVTIQSLAERFFMLPLWNGIIPSIILPFSAFSLVAGRNITEEKDKRAIAMLVTVLAATTFSFFFLFIAAKAMSLLSIAAVIFCGLALSKFISFESGKMKALVLVLCLLTFFTSGLLTELREGTKITSEETEFANYFKEKYPELSPTLFLTKNGLKIAELSNKIPYDVYADFPDHVFLAYGTWQTHHDEYWNEIAERKNRQDMILAEKCAGCISELSVKYVVVEEDFPAVQGKKLFEKYGFKVYGAGG